MLKSLSTSLILRGVAATLVGILALAWPGVTVFALVILFAVYAFVAGGLQTIRAFSSDTAGPVFGHLLLGLVSLAAGVIALAWPLPTALVLVLIVGTWAVISGLVEILSAFRAGESAGTRAMFLLGGLVSIVFGLVLLARPGMGAVTLALVFGLFNLIYGAWVLLQGIELRRTSKSLHSIFDHAKAA
jgi:uncharacterized membrane protein HdeD (DUF308 family)